MSLENTSSFNIDALAAFDGASRVLLRSDERVGVLQDKT